MKCQFLVLSLVLVGVTGCSGRSDRPELGLVTGTISFKGAPLVGASVTFLPDGGRPSVGKTDSSGSYQLVYIRNVQGAKIGSNRVEIRSLAEGADTQHDGDGEEVAQKVKRVTKEIVPAKYNQKSELLVDVKSGKNTFDFNLQ